MHPKLLHKLRLATLERDPDYTLDYILYPDIWDEHMASIQLNTRVSMVSFTTYYGTVEVLEPNNCVLVRTDAGVLARKGKDELYAIPPHQDLELGAS